jgi:hypothetical protein
MKNDGSNFSENGRKNFTQLKKILFLFLMFADFIFLGYERLSFCHKFWLFMSVLIFSFGLMLLGNKNIIKNVWNASLVLQTMKF